MKRLLSVVVLFFLIVPMTFGQQISLNDKLPMDSRVKIGQLENGLKYYILKNEEPKDRAELRLVVKAGSILESESQRGLAHFYEHMNFNGTENFPKNDLVDFLEKSGIKFGADLNAYTSFDETVYMLPVPSDDWEQFEKYMSVLADWSGKATLDEEEIEKERGVILEESRSRKGAQQRINEHLYPLLFKGSRYAERLPIGLEEVIENAPRSEFVAFKNDWYRPNLQAIVAVGDFNTEKVEALIQKQFGGFTNPANAPERVQYSVPLDGSVEAIVITDQEQPYTIANIFYLHPENKEVYASDRRSAIVRSLFNQMLSKRLSELTQKADPPFIAGIGSYGGFLAGLDAMTSGSLAKGNEVERAIIAVLDENQRALRFGFTENELNQAKLQYRTNVEKSLAEREKTASGRYVNELVQGFLNDVVMTDIAYDKEFIDQYLDGIEVAEVNDFVKRAITDENIVLALIGPEKEKENLPSVERLKELLKDTGSEITPYEDEEVAESLVSRIPAAGKIIAEESYPEVGVTRITFANEVNVYLKPTDFKNDEIIFTGTRWGGNSLYADREYDNALLASSVASQSGNGDLSNIQLTNYLTGKVARVNASIGDITESVSGSSSVKDIETALQMLYNRFTNNNLDEDVVKGFLDGQKSFYENMEATPTPEKVYGDTLSWVMTDYHFRGRPMTSERFANINAKRAMDIFNERFKDATGFNFTFVGNFDIEEIKPLLATYIGSLRATGRDVAYNDLGITPAKGVVEKTIRQGTEDKANVTLVFSGTYEPGAEEELQMRALGEALQIKLLEKLREDEGGVYSTYARFFTERFPSPKYQLRIGFGCAPDNVEKLIAGTLAEIEQVKENGATSEDLGKFISNTKLNYQTNLKNNNYWLGQISSKVQRGEELASILDYEKMLEKITPESSKATANKYLTGENYIKAVLLPEE